MLTDLACRKALPGPKDRKLAGARGLFLLLRHIAFDIDRLPLEWKRIGDSR